MNRKILLCIVVGLALVGLCWWGWGRRAALTGGLLGGEKNGKPEQADGSVDWEAKPEDVARVGLKKGFATMPDYLESDELLKVMSDPSIKNLGKAALEARAQRMSELMDMYSGPTNRMPYEVEYAPDVAVWADGLVSECQALVALHEPYRTLQDPSDIFPIDINEEMNWKGVGAAGDVPLVIIPTMALYGRGADSSVKADLKAYVEKGGVALVLAQPQGADFAAVPTPEGEPLEAVGYSQDLSNVMDPTVRMADHPMLNGFAGAAVRLKVDGFFIRYPRQSTVLLRRRDTGLPCLLLYPLGKGWIVASSAFFTPCDEKALKGNPGMLPFLAGVVAWAKDPARAIPTEVVRRGQAPGKMHLELEVQNLTAKAGDHIKYAVYSPTRDRILAQGTATAQIPAHGKTTVGLDVKVDSPTGEEPMVPGTYHVDYQISDRRWFWSKAIQPWAETNSGRFALVGPQPPSDSKWSTYFAAWCDADDPAKSKNQVFLYVEDRTGQPRDFRVKSNFSIEPVILLDSFHLEPGESKLLTYPYGLSRLGSYHFWLLDPVVGPPSSPQTSAEWGGDPLNLVGKRWVVMHLSASPNR